jgi:hypothetical protein
MTTGGLVTFNKKSVHLPIIFCNFRNGEKRNIFQVYKICTVLYIFTTMKPDDKLGYREKNKSTVKRLCFHKQYMSYSAWVIHLLIYTDGFPDPPA